MSVRPDNRLGDAPMMPVSCQTCGARVLARKSSWEQTSVQWDTAAMAQCVGRVQSGAGLHRGMLLECPRLRESIEIEARRGSLPILDET